MSCWEVMQQRTSIRAYKDAAVEPEKLERILAAAQIAPTACNLQPFKLLVIKMAGREAELKKIYNKEWFVQAPLVIGICTLLDKAWSRMDKKNYADIDAAIVMQHMILAAAELGLGTCWVGAFDPQAARDILELEAGWEPIAFTPIGYPAVEPVHRPRKALADLVVYK